MKARQTFVALLVVLVPVVAQAGENSPIGQRIGSFSARDYRGKEVALADLADSKLVVVAFLGTECPLAKLYGPRLVEMQKEYADKGVAFVGVDSNRQDLGTEVAYYAREHKIEFPLLKDAGNTIADAFGAQRTPEVFVLDADRVVRYCGRVDDQYGFFDKGIAYRRDEPKRRDLAEALDELLAGKAVSQSLTPVQGCLIGRVKEPVADSDVTYSNQIVHHPQCQLRCLPPARPDRALPADVVRRGGGLGGHDSRSRPGASHAPVARRSQHRALHQRRSAEGRGREAHRAWVANGAPEGNPKDVPEAPSSPRDGRFPSLTR